MNARIRDGWIEVDCDAEHMAAVGIIIGTGDKAIPAFRGFGEDGKRTAKIRPPADLHRPARLRVIVDGQETGTVTIR